MMIWAGCIIKMLQLHEFVCTVMICGVMSVRWADLIDY